MCTLDLRLQILRQTPFFAGLADQEVEQIGRAARERGYQAGDVIYSAGEAATRLYIVAMGQVKLTRPTPTGQNVLLDVLTQGDYFGSLSTLGDREYSDTAEAQTDCCVLVVTAGEFQDILRRYPPVALATLEIVAARLRAAHDLVEQISALPVESRIAATLLKLAEKLGKPEHGDLLIQMPLSRQDLAEMTGTTTETVSRIMSRFRKDHLIRSGRRWVAITNRDRLAAIAAGAAA